MGGIGGSEGLGPGSRGRIEGSPWPPEMGPRWAGSSRRLASAAGAGSGSPSASFLPRGPRFTRLVTT